MKALQVQQPVDISEGPNGRRSIGWQAESLIEFKWCSRPNGRYVPALNDWMCDFVIQLELLLRQNNKLDGMVSQRIIGQSE